MNDYIKKLDKTYKEIATLAYELLEVDNPEIRQIHEDGISSMILKKIEKLKLLGYSVKTKSLKINENETGKDFDLWIGENDNRYVRFSVQAKSFRNNTQLDESYDINFNQCENLINHAAFQKHRSYPLYFLYQYINDKSLAQKHFAFLDDFVPEFSSITFTSAFAMKTHISKNELEFQQIHLNDIKDSRWIDEAYYLFEKEEQSIGLPLYCLRDISPSKVEKFERLTSDKNNSFGYFYFFFFGQNEKFYIHDISSLEILKLYGTNERVIKGYEGIMPLETKNLLIINDNNKLLRERTENLNSVINE
ncbi:DUF6615 family protein [Mesoflavibacter zeaxanthinifaciens]|jgi:hypothetical protein|uniref:DUF6615 family protein n=1 Tax=Mesoflavibacter zeaxanthinifaciens TaxID=393060 RepID=UPI003A8C8A89